MAQDNNIAQQLNDLLVTRDFHPELRNAAGSDKNVEPKDAKVFRFNYVSGSGKNYGTMVIVLDAGNDLKAFYGDNLGRGMEDQDKQEWYDFQQQLMQFSNNHRWTYTGTDISKLKHTMQGLAAIKEGLFEGYYGTNRISYAGEPTEARLMIRHNRKLGENDARFRYVESIFVETADGERYRLPFTNLAGGRAMLEHVRQGGKPYDVRGNHICEMITELKVLTRFNRASQGRVLEGIKQGVVEGAQTYYKSLRESIKRMAGSRGYNAYFESWHPANITEQDQLVEDIKTLFVEQTIDDRIEQALPLLAKIQRGREMKEADIFENWVNSVTESHWSLPETPEQLNRLKELMSGELIVGPDGTNAKEQLRDLIGDDDLFNRIEDLAAQDPDANLWDDTDVQDILRALGIQMPDRAAPDMNAQPQPQQGMAEGSRIPTLNQLLKTSSPSPKDTYYIVQGSVADEEGRDVTVFNIYYNDKSVFGPYYNPKSATRKLHQLRSDGHEVIGERVEQGMSEADNIAAFESLQRMRHLSGMPLKESRVEESSEFMYEKIGQTLAQQQPILDVNSDQFVHAVYDEMIELGMTPKSAKHKLSYDRDFLGDVATSFYHYAQHGTNDMLDEAGDEFPPLSDPSKYPEVAATQPLPADAFSTGQLTVRPTPTTSPAAGPVVGASTNPAVQQAVKDASGGQFVAKTAPPPAAAPAAEYTGPTAGGAPTNLPAGINRLTGKPNAPAAPAPAPAASAPAASAPNSLQNNVLPSGATTRSLAKPAPVEEDQYQSEFLRRRGPGGFPMKNFDNSLPNTKVAPLDLSKQQTEPDPLDAMKKSAGLPTIAPRTVKAVDLVKNPELAIGVGEPQWDYKDSQPAAAGMSSDTQALKDRIVRMAAQDQMRQDQTDRITRMAGVDDSAGKTTGASGYYDSNGMLHIDMSAGLEESAPLEECNYTMENNYCPVHGLKECWLEEMNQSILATGSRLIEDLDEDYGPSGPTGGKVRAMGTNIFKRGPKSTGAFDTEAGYFAQPEYRDATRSQADNDRAKRIRDWEKQTGQDDVSPEFHGQFRPIPPRTPTPQTSAAVAKPVPSARITATDLPDEVDDQGRQYFQNYVIDTDGKQIPRIRVDGVGRTQDEHMDEDMTDVGDVVGQAARSARDYLGKTANNLSDFVGQVQSKTYEPIGNFIKGVKQGYNGKASEKSKGQAHAGQGGYDYSDEEPVAMPVRSPDITAYDLPGDEELDEASYMDPQVVDLSSDNEIANAFKLLNQYKNGKADFAANNQRLLDKMNGQDKSIAAPSFSMPGAAHAGQGGYDYNNEEPDQSDAETARLARFGAPDEPKGQAHAGQGGYDYNDQDPDQSDAETARLGRYGASADSEFVHAPGEAGRSINYESREGDAMLARIKSLALIR
jgi:hypothetical protein